MKQATIPTDKKRPGNSRFLFLWPRFLKPTAFFLSCRLRLEVNESSKEVDEHISLQSDNEYIVNSVNLVEDRVVGVDGVDDEILGVDGVDDGIVGVDGATVPKVGMKFNDEKDIYDFYKRYVYNVGFPVGKRNSQKDDYGVVKYVVFTCRNSNATGSLKPHATIQTGCKARITASLDACGIWKINTVNLNHNHKTSPSKSKLYRCNRELSSHVKRRLEVNDMIGIPLHKSYHAAVVKAGRYENLTCIEKDRRNYVEQVRRLRLGDGDAAAIQTYFSKMQGRSRQAYKEFDDVVTFDTTYLTNKYDMSFAPFVGINHHGMLLDCGLVSNESTKTFVWLFRTWLQCMHGQAPKRITTDQDKAIQNAIQIVFPNTRHRWCLWHILKMLPEKYGYHTNKGVIFSTLHVLVYDSQIGEEFEEGWEAMINNFNLHDDDWLSRLYANRGRWVPCYLKNTFWPGMSTTQGHESMNAFFDGYFIRSQNLGKYKRNLLGRFTARFLRRRAAWGLHRKYGRMSYVTTGLTRRSPVSHFRKRIVKLRAITVLLCNNVKSLPNTYVLRRWRKDVVRAHRRVAVNYDGLSSTPTQLRYDKMCQSFARLVNITADDENEVRSILE
ncbi:protein FAR-RED IMPAIRED RESPONSE 1-like [Olea europaea var. sylvestris]|uniref:protein FAR-RED IMPAIRED RESPONSE 1-like n=1 Tax=Olea europaea var. sylvestris TaxID=158386 RepID=UPI000C1D7137|nr:protein FAR-RED IMPAIRED RESPONSE 1-like [Olea europaea var. sylvestris]